MWSHDYADIFIEELNNGKTQTMEKVTRGDLNWGPPEKEA
jgi:hypothetical protein